MQLYSGTDYSKAGTKYYLFQIKVAERPVIKLSTEHSSYIWTDQDTLLQRVADCKDDYMIMVGQQLNSYEPI